MITRTLTFVIAVITDQSVDPAVVNRLCTAGLELAEIGSNNAPLDESHLADIAEAVETMVSVMRRASASNGGRHA